MPDYDDDYDQCDPDSLLNDEDCVDEPYDDEDGLMLLNFQERTMPDYNDYDPDFLLNDED